ncbi:M56 family metallopeptidase [Novosphingobium sp. P6W]|uniref:M56 family metallopeptidase n=1 Tax=Novosphingobium sp. P6W TaxID=1609758 RepID=UPI0005C3185D|nr:M56 family metallopeptidase [Novosphingobium sp. P6W]AXB77076.1 antirepressor regulating drug resistance protein [Novosphingobium sp. P6W]KIS29759.1 antirepressor regulating drug resistance protein [Novosphingobium sp. P6W]
MIEWLTDTLIATGALMALVLAARGPVARWFGPGAAYALWALPMIRLVLPPLALPRGLLPRIEFGVEPLTASAAGLHAAIPIEAAGIDAMPAATAIPAAQLAAAAEPSLLAQVPWMTLALAVWLGGAALFLLWRTVTYRWMRRDLLEGSRLVARSGAVRIVESPAITAPLAFGVFDKVVALPMDFLADEDSETSDFAIAHEMEHHAGGDLLALIAMQPLFALHWFNPLGWAGWRAVRSDQEAACDARVMLGRSREERARYGRLIASLAGGDRLGLAAPMAGSLSGEKPIIHRLKALARKDVTPARRVLARSLFALAIVAVPATATVSYAAMEEADVPEVPAVPAAPAAPAVSYSSDAEMRADAQAPQAPQAPDVPEVPDAPAAPQWADGAGAVPPAPPSPPMPPVPGAAPVPPAPPAPMSLRNAMSQDQARRAADADRRASDAERRAAGAMARAPQVEERVSSDGKRRTISIVRSDASGAGKVIRQMILDEDCPADSNRRQARGEANGTSASVVICTGEPKAAKQAAVTAIRSARASIASNRDLDTQVRAEILSDLDRELADAMKEARGS